MTFTLENSDGELVSSWMPGETYVLSTTSEEGHTVQAFVHASVGALNTIYTDQSEGPKVGFQSATCENAWGSMQASKTHHTKWDAPAVVPTGGLCVVFSSAHATSGSAAYQTNSVRLPLGLMSV